MPGSIYIGLIVADLSTIAKINEKHHLTLDEVREALQWPAPARVGYEDHPEPGGRWIAVGTVAGGRDLIAALLPSPMFAGSGADTWVLKTARWI